MITEKFKISQGVGMLAKVLVVFCMLSLSSAFAATAAAKPARSVEMYVTSWCHYCREAQSYLKSNGIAFTAYDIENDGAALQRYNKLGGGGVPILVIGSQVMYGFNKAKFESIMKNEK